MRKIIAGAMMSLDGIIQAPGGPEEDPTGGFKFGGWVWPHFDDEMGEIIGEMFSKPFDLLLGRKTYDIFAAYWPYMKDDPMGPLFDKVTKFVATRDPDFKPDWQTSRSLGPDAVAALKQLKREDGPDLLTQGSADFLKTLLAHGLVDEFNVSIFPVILGTGKHLFGDAAKPAGLKLISVTSSPSGVVAAKYAPEGEVQTGSFAADAPSEAEIERRKKLT